MGISEFGEMERLSDMAQPDICVITNIGLCHLENLKTRDGILKAKTECFAHLAPQGTVVLNGDDDKLAQIRMVNGKPVMFYGLEKEAALFTDEAGERSLAEKEVYATGVHTIGIEETEAVIHMGREQFTVRIPLAGEHNVYNALAAVCVGKELLLSAEEMKQGIAAVRTVSGRSHLIKKDGITVIDDCYNANPVSMKASLDVLAKAPGRTIAVLGDMGELGEQERELHAMVGRHFAGKGIDALFCTGELSASLAKEVRRVSPKTRVLEFSDKDTLIDALLAYKTGGDTILVKASHFMGYTAVIEALLA